MQQPRSPVQRIPAGVLVGEVQAGTPAAAALLRPGDVITHVNGRPVAMPAAFYREVQNRTGPLELTLTPGDPGQPLLPHRRRGRCGGDALPRGYWQPPDPESGPAGDHHHTGGDWG